MLPPVADNETGVIMGEEVGSLEEGKNVGEGGRNVGVSVVVIARG